MGNEGYRILKSAAKGIFSDIFTGEYNSERCLISRTNREYIPVERNEKAAEIIKYISSQKIKGYPEILKIDRDGDSIVMIMKDVQGQVLESLASDGSAGLAEFFQIAQLLTDLFISISNSNLELLTVLPESIIYNRENRSVMLLEYPFMDTRSLFEVISNGFLHSGRLSLVPPEILEGRKYTDTSSQYILGVIFYYLMTGRYPFLSEERIETLRSAASALFPAPESINEATPPILSVMIQRLMNYDPSERYSSLESLKADIDKCAYLLKIRGEVENFIPDSLSRISFKIKQRFYGRDGELALLKETYDKVLSGGIGFVSVHGPAGIGKTTLIQDLFRPLVQNRSYFIYGKCDHYTEELPYSPVIHAFRELVGEILRENRGAYEIWKESIMDALGNNARVISDVIPDLLEIIGPQDDVPELGAEESRNRFNMVFTGFVRVFASSGRPLVIFLDDLQWIDSATLTLLKYILSGHEISPMLILGAYRDNEVSEFHSLSLFMKQLSDSGVKVLDADVRPLGIDEINKIISDTVKCEAGKSVQLAEFALSYTGGNPLYLNQLLKTLYDEKLIFYDEIEGWEWDFNKIRSVHGHDDMASLLVKRVNSLPPEKLHILTTASCIGCSFDAETLALALGMTADRLKTELKHGIEAGYVSPFWSDYRFAHDKVYEAVYSSMKEEERIRIHYSMGRLLLEKYGEGDLKNRIFPIVNHLNASASLIRTEEEREQVIRLNLIAGKAGIATAYETALRYFRTAIELLPPDSWVRNYELSLKLYMDAFECAYLAGNLSGAYAYFDIIKSSCSNSLDLARLYNLNVVLLTNHGKIAMAIDAGIEGLKILGLNLNRDPDIFYIFREKTRLRLRLGGKSAADLLELPVMDDPKYIEIMSMLLNIWMPGNLVNSRLRDLITMKMVSTSIKKGNCSLSSFGYMGLGMMLCSSMERYSDGYDFGRLALTLNKKFGNTVLDTKLNVMFGSYIAHWVKHVDVEIIKKAHSMGIQSGDFYYASGAALISSYTMMIAGYPLNEVLRTARKFLDFSIKINNIHVRDALIIIIRNIKQLRGETKDSFSLGDDKFDEEVFLSNARIYEVTQPIYLYGVLKSRNLYIFGHYSEALALIPDEKEMDNYNFSTYLLPERNFVHSLILAGLYDNAAAGVKKEYRNRLLSNQRRMKRWSDNSPSNFYDRYLIIEAEIRRLDCDNSAAIWSYTEAIKASSDQKYLNNEALGHELKGKLLIKMEYYELGAFHLNRAVKCYEKWGATAKALELKNGFADYLEDYLHIHDVLNETEEPPDPVKNPDFREILGRIVSAGESSNPVQELASMILEFSGAERVVLLTVENGDPAVRGEQRGGVFTPFDKNRADSGFLSTSMIKYASKSFEALNVTDPVHDERFRYDPYLMKNIPSAVLIIPLMLKGEIEGFIYIENNLADRDIPAGTAENLMLIAPAVTVSMLSPEKEEEQQVRMSGDRSILKNINVDSLIERLMKLMEEEKLYAIEEFTLSMLSTELSISNKQLSQILNDRFNVNFNTFINRYRVEEAKKMLASDPDRSVVSIAYDVGFSSVSPFYNAFLKFTGISPARFRKNIQA